MNPCLSNKNLLQITFYGDVFVQLPHTFVDCVECVSPALLYHQVLLTFFGPDAAAMLPRCPSLSDFVRLYKQMSSKTPATQTRYIVSTLLCILYKMYTQYMFFGLF